MDSYTYINQKMMKRIAAYLVVLLCFGLLFASCQKEESEFIDKTDQDGVITTSSALAGLLLGASQNPGSQDNIIDGNSCSQIKYPVTVIANGQEVVLENVEDLELIRAIFDQFPEDDDTLEIMFPITVVLQDFSEIILNDLDELDDLIDTCEEKTEMACVDFVYPITLFTYDTEQEQTGTIVIENDEELYLLFYGLDEEDLISIDFPISIILKDGTSVTVHSNEDLEDTLELVNCEDDDDDFDDIEEEISTGSWYITYYFDDYDETDIFVGYEFSFVPDHTAEATNGTNTVLGTWSLNVDGAPELDIFFGTNAPFGKLTKDWEIVEANAEIIRLRDVNGGDPSVDYLTFERNPNSGGSNEDVNVFIQNLVNGTWFVSLYKEEGTDGTANYSGYEFTFFTNSSVTAVGPTGTINGFWQIEEEDNELAITFNFDSASNEHFEDLNDDWMVLASSSIMVRLGDDSGGTEDLLTFEKN